jgi:predicted nucleic acid-binding protein
VIVVSDTTAVTSLVKIDRAVLLQDLFEHVLIPEAVRDELLKYHSDLPGFLEVQAANDRTSVNCLRNEIDAGEAEAIILAEEIGADALLIDDKQGRASRGSRTQLPRLGRRACDGEAK